MLNGFSTVVLSTCDPAFKIEKCACSTKIKCNKNGINGEIRIFHSHGASVSLINQTAPLCPQFAAYQFQSGYWVTSQQTAVNSISVLQIKTLFLPQLVSSYPTLMAKYH
jgi:hypothetical protein